MTFVTSYTYRISHKVHYWQKHRTCHDLSNQQGQRPESESQRNINWPSSHFPRSNPRLETLLVKSLGWFSNHYKWLYLCYTLL